MELTDYIYIKQNGYDESQELINFLNEIDKWQGSLIGDGERNEARVSQQTELTYKHMDTPADKELMREFTRDIRSAFLQNLRQYLNPHKVYCEVSQDEGLFCLKYGEGGYYKAHSDGDTKSFNRRVSGLIYLNDDFEGGELYFPNFDLTIKPKTGMLVLFPSNFCFPHASLPIKSGVKYAVVTWFR